MRRSLSGSSNTSLTEIIERVIDVILSAAEIAESKPVEATHQVRKSLKKCRALVKLTRHLHSKNDYMAINQALRDQGKHFSDLRDVHVRVELFDALIQDSEFQNFKTDLEEFKKVNQETVQQHEAILIHEEKNFLKLQDALQKNDIGLLPYFDSEPISLSDLQKGIDQSFKASNSAYQQIDQDDSETLHEWRKRLKDVQYQLEAVGEITQQSYKQDTLGIIIEINDLLGIGHDYFMLSEWIEEKGEFNNSENVDRFLNKLFLKRRSYQSSAFTLAEKLYSLTSQNFTSFIYNG